MKKFIKSGICAICILLTCVFVFKHFARKKQSVKILCPSYQSYELSEYEVQLLYNEGNGYKWIKDSLNAR